MDPSMENDLEGYFSPEDLAKMGLSKEELAAMGFSQNDSGTCSTMAANSSVSVSIPPVVSLSSQEMHKYSQEFLVELPGNRSLVPLDDKIIKHAINETAETMIGLDKYFEMERADAGLCEVLLSSLPKRLRDLQEKVKNDVENAFPLLDTLLKNRKQIEEDLQENGETPVLLKKREDNQENFYKELDKIYFPLSLKLKKTADDFLLGVLSNLLKILEDIKEQNDFVVTLEEVKNEASRWIYFHMRGQNQKVAIHPRHIKNIPGDWRREHPGCNKNCRPLCRECKRTFYPSEPAYRSIASYTGLEIDQVIDLFTNDRRRRAYKDPVAGDHGRLKKHFGGDKTNKLRVWKAQNPGKKVDESSLKELMDATGMDKKQIRNWFGNNAPGRENRNLSSKRSSL